MLTPSDTASLAAAFGSICGYLGGEVAEATLFEQLLWPARFHNRLSPGSLFRSALLHSMGGPLHKAALATLDAFRKKGLYKGMQQGHMLGSAFYPDSKLRYKLHAYEGIDKDNEVRNGLWSTVLQRVKHYQSCKANLPSEMVDMESNETKPLPRRRTSQMVQHLKLDVVKLESKLSPNTLAFSEDHTGTAVLVSILVSETMALLCAALVIYLEHGYSFAAYLCVPLILKLVAVLFSVDREPILGEAEKTTLLESTNMIILEIQDYDNGFPVIEGPEDVVRQFFRHWGHPVRQCRRDRIKEVISIVTILGFVMNFPIGLLSMLWTSQATQLIWLSYQMLTLVAMHINRLCGLDGPARIEDGIARHLATGGTVRLESHGVIVEAQLESQRVGRIAHGRERVLELVRMHTDSMREKNLLN